MADISNNIKTQRLKHHLSQSQLAEKVGVTRQTVSSWERGASYPDIYMLEKISSIFQIGIDELLYPHFSERRKIFTSKPLSIKFVVISIFLYFVLLIWGGGIIAVPLFRRLVGGSIEEEFIFIIYWGLILLVGYIALCTYLISEYCTLSSSERQNSQGNSKEQTEMGPELKEKMGGERKQSSIH